MSDTISTLSNRIAWRLAKTTVVVVLKVNGKYTLLMDPGLGTPWRGQGIFGEKRGDDLARDAEANGVPAKRMTWEEAYALLLKDAGGEKAVEKVLMERVVKKQANASNPNILPE
jgi:hypothetical protein